MKVICPIDFSEASINAANWIASFLDNIEGSEIHLAHFVYEIRRASMFLSIQSILVDRAKNDLKQLSDELNKSFPNLQIKTSIYTAHPKEGIVSLANDGLYELIVTGTTGLTALKNITIGSVTEYAMRHSKTPVLAIPESARFRGLDKIALSVDDDIIEQLESLGLVRDLCGHTNASLYLIHVTMDNESPFEYDPGIDLYFSDLKFKYERLDKQNSIAETLNDYCVHHKMDMLCMVHHKRNWLEYLLQKSITKSKLFKLGFPLLILPE